MEMYLEAVISNARITTLAEVEEYFELDHEFGIKCKILNHISKIFSDTYQCSLNGENDNIDGFLNFLRMKGFKIKKVH